MRNEYIIVPGCGIVLGPHNAMPLADTDLIRRKLSVCRVIGYSSIKNECNLVFKMVRKYAVQHCIFIYDIDVKNIYSFRTYLREFEQKLLGMMSMHGLRYIIGLINSKLQVWSVLNKNIKTTNACE